MVSAVRYALRQLIAAGLVSPRQRAFRGRGHACGPYMSLPVISHLFRAPEVRENISYLFFVTPVPSKSGMNSFFAASPP